MGLFVGVVFAMAASLGVVSPHPTESGGGIYLTAEDYAQGKVSEGGSCQAGSYRVALHDITNKPFIDVTHGTEKKRYAKDGVFGVRLCDGHDYRLVSSRLFRILEAKSLYVYAVERPVTQGKGFRVVPAYYFSSGARGEVLPLTLDNLHRVYASNHRFIDSLDRVWEREIAEYDAYHQQFKVGRLLAESTPDH